jgi:glycerophosphoryl diester phosphodiesterase
MPSKLENSRYVGLHRPTIFAHRGASAYAPENTLFAFKLAVEQGADAVELDTQLTRDGQVVVMHDLTIDRTTNGTGWINRYTLSELQMLDAGSHFDASFKNEKVPSLAEVFEVVGKQVFIDVELKNYASPTDDLPVQVVELASKYNLEQSILFSSFNPLALLRAHRLMPNVPLGLLTMKGKRGAILRSWLGRWIPHQALHPAWNDVTPTLVKNNHQHGYRVHPYTINDPTVMRDLLSAGVDGIFTNDPPLALKVLAGQRQTQPVISAPA